MDELEKLREWVRRAHTVVIVARASGALDATLEAEADWAFQEIPLRAEWCRICTKDHALLPWERPCHEEGACV